MHEANTSSRPPASRRGSARAKPIPPARRGHYTVAPHSRESSAERCRARRRPPSSTPIAPAVERTLILLKPDAVERGLVGPILSRFERKGLKLAGMKLRRFEPALLEKHYAEHKEKPFFRGLVEFMGSGPVVALAIEGVDAITVCRNLIGATNGRKAAPGTIRGDYGMSFSTNLVHGSDGPEAAKRELALFFPEAGELVDWRPTLEPWTYSVAEELS